MSDDTKGPVWRPQSHQDRDAYVPKHQTPVGGVPSFVVEECTGKYEGADLQAIRSRRPTPERIRRLEDKHDALDRVVIRMDSKLDTLKEMADAAAAERESRRRHLPATIKALGYAVALGDEFCL